MDGLRILGFVVIIVLTHHAVLDYYQQDKKHEGTLSANGYVDIDQASLRAATGRA